MRERVLTAAAVLAMTYCGCFAPEIRERIGCGEDGLCPVGLECDRSTNECYEYPPNWPSPDARVDAVPDATLDPGCGDGILDGAMDEACDDGNTASGDGCSSTCAIEVSVAAGPSHTCAVTDTGGVRCWGGGLYGALGYAGTFNVGDEPSRQPMPFQDVAVDAPPGEPPEEPMLQVVVGDYHSCARSSSGRVRCWGSATAGQLGYSSMTTIGDDEHPFTAGPVELGDPATRIAAGGRHTCAITAAGEVFCWGFNASGQLGLGHTDNIGDQSGERLAPVTLDGTPVALALGRDHSCVLMADGRVQCWGSGTFGQLGQGHTDDVRVPVTVELGASAIGITAGDQHTCAWFGSEEFKCWGQGEYGALGYGNTNNIGDDERPEVSSSVPVGSPVVGVAAGVRHTCALLAGGAVRCFGDNEDGRLGYGNTDAIVDAQSSGDVSVGGDDPAVQLAASSHTCAVLTDGAIRCWGRNVRGQLGLNRNDNIGDDELPSSVGPALYR